MNRIKYWNRIFKAYILPTTSQLSFWHGTPEINPVPDLEHPKHYYMKFHYKANYNGHFDEQGIPMLDYHGNIGLQYNPIAIAQYGLGNYNLYLNKNDTEYLNKFYAVADWLIKSLKPNQKDVYVWHHYFDFEYRDTLKSPWYSGLAQGLGLSVLARAYEESNKQEYLEAHKKAWISMTKKIDEGGVIDVDKEGNYWIEEYIVDPPTHILNGFIWALWGVYDTWKFLEIELAEDLFKKCCKTLEKNIKKYDNGYWSLYDQAGLPLNNLASSFYHKLHIVQLEILSNLSGNHTFQKYADKWRSCNSSNFYKYRALFNKSVFKILYY